MSTKPQARTPVVVDDETAWEAVITRDPRFDGQFYLGVKTTGIYCRPTCPARRPLRKNVTFYDSPDAAEAAGFRACLRCRPRAEETLAARRLRAVREHIDTHLDDRLTLDALARLANMSPFHLQRAFKRAVGLSPRAYRDAQRLARLRGRLKEGDTVSRATYEAGFGSSSSVYAKAAGALGMTPSAYRRGGKGETIRYTTAKTAFGTLLVGATEKGVCSVMLGDATEPLVESLSGEFPRAELRRDDDSLGSWARMIATHVEGGRTPLDVPMDIRGTEFQRRVWEALRTIPNGSTRSYRDVATTIGHPAAVRAVAQACARNPVALLVPCHRVVRTDGAVGGYRWGAERKQRILDRERNGPTL
jgi:AraC family transcriptional regulator, regulatory protein of adaptative response / methylated-DNA-[protein]-cysteine methyltransferase